VHAARGSVAVLEGASFDQPATKQAAQALQKWGARSPTLVVLDAEEVAALKSFRNIPRVTVTLATAVGVADIIGHASLVISQEALEVLQARASEVQRGGPTTDAAETGSPEESEAAGEDSEG
jgi:large subunit ribosomal protein L4